MLNLWNINGNKITLNEDEMQHTIYVRAFRDLRNQVTSDADSIKLFIYVWNMADYRSLGIQHGYSQKELNEYAIKQANLPSNFIPTVVMTNAIAMYNELQDDVIEEQFKYIKQVHHNTARMLQLLNTSLDGLLKKTKLTSSEMDDLIEIQTRVNKIADDLPKRIKSLRELEAVVVANRASKKVLRGQKEFRSSMDGDRV